ncbi:MAG: hypothetical protein QE263_04520 [Vampirovibrionales bacterium]|nr:hypothetical protein [Vampirovibrionales bacterium]
MVLELRPPAGVTLSALQSLLPAVLSAMHFLRWQTRHPAWVR